jgi:hypothetical protein
MGPKPYFLNPKILLIPEKSHVNPQSMRLNLRFSHLTSTATLFKHMNYSRNGNKRSSIESKNKNKGNCCH